MLVEGWCDTLFLTQTCIKKPKIKENGSPVFLSDVAIVMTRAGAGVLFSRNTVCRTVNVSTNKKYTSQ